MCVYEHIQEEAYQANLGLSDEGMIIFNFGNASAVDRDMGVFAIRPEVGPYQNYYPSDMIIVDFDARIVKGRSHPSADAKIHAVLYKNWDKIGGVVLAESPYASAWAQAGRMIPVLDNYRNDINCTAIPCTSGYKDEFSDANGPERIGHQIMDHFKCNDIDYQDLEMVLVGNFTPFTWGMNAEKAVANSNMLENLARKTLVSLLENPAQHRSPESTESARCVHTELILFKIKQQVKQISPL